jgi:hypothetical protein
VHPIETDKPAFLAAIPRMLARVWIRSAIFHRVDRWDGLTQRTLRGKRALDDGRVAGSGVTVIVSLGGQRMASTARA